MELRGQDGFTLTELIAYLGIITILLAIASIAIADYQQRTRLRTTAEAVAADIREARWKARFSGEVCTIMFFTDDRSYSVNGMPSTELPSGIRFGTDMSVTSRPSQPYDLPPIDGVSFDSGKRNIARFYPTGVVSPTGAVFLTNGKETFAITVAITGRPKLWRSAGGKQWVAY